jgi:hypothetical protein
MLLPSHQTNLSKLFILLAAIRGPTWMSALENHLLGRSGTPGPVLPAQAAERRSSPRALMVLPQYMLNPQMPHMNRLLPLAMSSRGAAERCGVSNKRHNSNEVW